jgi:hypothetical protein
MLALWYNTNVTNFSMFDREAVPSSPFPHKEADRNIPPTHCTSTPHICNSSPQALKLNKVNGRRESDWENYCEYEDHGKLGFGVLWRCVSLSAENVSRYLADSLARESYEYCLQNFEVMLVRETRD